MKTEVEVELLFSTTEALDEARRVSALYPQHKCKFTLLKSGSAAGIVHTHFPFLHRPLTLLLNRRFLASFDALIAPEKNYISLKAIPSFRKVKFIGLRHGAGDRPVSFNKGPLKFDFLLVPGKSYYQRFKDELPEGCCEIAGYPKFEVLDKLKNETPQLFDNNLPVVLYTPHFHRRQSSWISMGIDVLNFFADHEKYNLIFAPHARLFEHRIYHNNINLDKFKNIKNIHIDTGSDRSFDMSYTSAADIYVGDVSSQVYEFLYIRNRPCVFLNPKKLDPAQMSFWQLGPIIGDINSLERSLEESRAQFENKYREKQRYFVDAAFATDERPPSQRGAEAILRFLGY